MGISKLNSSTAGKIALRLDFLDDLGQDGTITKNIWDRFRAGENGEFIKDISDKGIETKKAVKLIINGIFNATKKAMESMGKSPSDTKSFYKQVNTIAKSWLGNLNKLDQNTNVNTAKEPISEVIPEEIYPAQPQEEVTPKTTDNGAVPVSDDEETKIVQADDETEKNTLVDEDKDSSDDTTIVRNDEVPGIRKRKIRHKHSKIDFTVEKREITAKKPEGKEVKAYKSRQRADVLSKNIQSAFDKVSIKHPIDSINNLKKQLSQINKDNVAFVVNNIKGLAEKIDKVDMMGMGLDKNDVFTYVLSPLMQKADELGIEDDYKKLTKSASLKEMSGLIQLLKSIILRLDFELISEYERKTDAYNKNKSQVEEFNKNIEKYQACFDHANKFLADSLNIKPAPRITKYSKGALIEFQDGRSITVHYDNHKIDSVTINHFPDVPDSSVKYTGFQAKCNLINDRHKIAVDAKNNPNTGYDFKKIIAYVKDLLA